MFDRHCAPIFTKKYFDGEYKVNEQDLCKLVFGLVISLRNSMRQLNSKYCSHATDMFKLHFYESPTGYKFVLTTHPSDSFMVSPASAHTATHLGAALRHIYTHLFMPLVIMNMNQPLSKPPITMKDRKAMLKKGESIPALSPIIDCPQFEERVDRFLKSLRL